ncbi:MAG: hypothetical protein ACSLFK_13365 [Gemmatimonadaceae bacterium]
MKISFFLAAAVIALASPVAAQEIDPQCPPGSLDGSGDPDNTMIAQDACQKAIDLFKYMAPQLGAVLAGGNPTQGISGAFGKIGRFSIGLRGNALNGSLPEVDKVVPFTRGAQQSSYSIDTKPIGFATADVALGVYPGTPAGFLAIDLLMSASYIPEYSNASIDVSLPSGSYKLGFGAKVGLISETAATPGVSVSYLTRELPRVDITGSSGEDRLLLEDVRVRSRSWRAVTGKSLGFLGIGGGYGRDTYRSNATITVTVAPRAATNGGTGGPIDLSQKLTRTNMFGSVWINSQVLRIVGEIGRVSGGNIETYNSFPPDAQPDMNRTYVSLGFSFGR